MKTKRTIGIVARIIIGLVFVVSALTKYLSIEAVDMFLFEHKLFSWDMTQFVTRFIIGFECFIGLSLVIGLCQKQVRWLTIGTLLAFTLYVIVKPLLFDVSSENCHCFGDVLILSDTQTIFKNVILLALSFFMFWQNGLRKKYAKWLLLAFFVLSTATVYTIKPPDVIVYSLYDKSAALDMEKFEILLQEEALSDLDIKEGEKVLCLYSTACKYCKRTAIKLNVMIERHDLETDDFVVAFWGKEKNITKFYNETQVVKLPTAIVPPDVFLSATKGKQPIIVLLDNGKVVDVYRSITLDEDKIVDFLE